MSLASEVHQTQQNSVLRRMLDADLRELIDETWKSLEDEHADRQEVLESLLGDLEDLRRWSLRV